MAFMLTTAALILSIVGLVLTAALKTKMPLLAYLHFAIAAAVPAVLATLAIVQAGQLQHSRASPSAVAASTARYLAMVWAWGALGIAVTYATQVLSWREWPQFLAAFSVAAGLSLAFSAMLSRDVAAGKDDPTLLRLARILSIAQLVGMAAVVIGLLLDGKMTRYLTPRYTDWAANNIFFCGALAVAAICAYALKTLPKPNA
jgi:hypothetical protein